MAETCPPAHQRLHPFQEVPVPIEIRIGRRTSSVQELASIRDGSIITLEKPAGETLDLFIAGIRFAAVEVVVIDDRLAVRVTEIDKSVIAKGSPQSDGR